MRLGDPTPPRQNNVEFDIPHHYFRNGIFFAENVIFGRPSVKAAIFFPFTEANIQYSPFDPVGAQLGDESRQIFCPLAAPVHFRMFSAICQKVGTSLPAI